MLKAFSSGGTTGSKTMDLINTRSMLRRREVEFVIITKKKKEISQKLVDSYSDLKAFHQYFMASRSRLGPILRISTNLY